MGEVPQKSVRNCFVAPEFMQLLHRQGICRPRENTLTLQDCY